MKEIQCILTNEEKQQFWQESTVAAEEVTDCMHVINVYPQVTYQKVEGFGGAFTEASAHNYSLLGKANQEAILEDYFGASGLRYNIGRIHMNSCDFGLGNYTYIEENDTTLQSFDVSHDEKEILPFIHAAVEKANGTMEILLSPWSPPAFMKSNHDMNHGGNLLKEYYQLWADYFVKFIQEYAARGVQVTSLTIQNEPEATQTWDSCRYTAEEEAEFLGDYLGPAMEAAGLCNIDIYIWDHNKEALFDRFSTSMANKNAAKYIKGAAVHWYTGDHFEAIEMVKKEYPGCKVIFSEGCVEYSRFADTKETQKAEMYAHDIMGNLNAGIASYYDWNLILDDKGGPNHVGNFCAAPIMCVPSEDTYEKHLTYYYIGQFSRYIKKGAVRIGTTKYTSDIEVSGYRNPDSSRCIVVMNRSDNAKEIALRENGYGVMTSIPAHSIVTYCYAN